LEPTEDLKLTLVIPDESNAIGIEEGAPVFAVGRIYNDDSM